MSATEELRALLDARGVEWTQGMAWNVTVINGDWLIVEDIDFGTLSVSTTTYQLTPEQAIAATLGVGECEMDAHGNCTACGEFVAKSWEHVRRFDGGYEAKPCRAHNYCPNCGRRVRKAVER